MNVVLRTTLPLASLAPTIERVVRETDRTVPIVRLRDMDTVFAESIRRPRLLAHLLGAFAGLALLLAAIGTYGVLTYMVAERRREIGIRMSLGADASNVLAQIMKQGLAADRLGVVRGLPAHSASTGCSRRCFSACGRQMRRRWSASRPRSSSWPPWPAACPPGGPHGSTRTWCCETMTVS